MTEVAAELIVSLPMYAELTPEQVQTVVDVVKRSILLKTSLVLKKAFHMYKKNVCRELKDMSKAM